MKALGFECILARDLTDSHPDYDLQRAITPDELTARTVAHFERYLCSTVNLKDELGHLGLLNTRTPIDPVRAAPWGTELHPHIFDDRTTVTLSTPLPPDAAIHYTKDGSTPTTASARYDEPIELTGNAKITAQQKSRLKPSKAISRSQFKAASFTSVARSQSKCRTFISLKSSLSAR